MFSHTIWKKKSNSHLLPPLTVVANRCLGFPDVSFGSHFCVLVSILFEVEDDL
jgi:hypothetical protein